ncbi:MAG: bifunctional adenosylcobinamide kinase/adenosylcobinamide-phosphate guanylyltransferase [Lachnospiraceae bacterium]|nr:bifunctional adenosylcobinamide kinase/adenosylcobinamide-phosphate guanylyltransferase [Lachnospiraceae bacterium]
MLVVVTGGSGSGKSEYAESRIVALREQYREENCMDLESDIPTYYIATMHAFDEETIKRIERHRAMRANKRFRTKEQYTSLQKLELKKENNPCMVLLECISNLVANELYQADGCIKNGKDCVSYIQMGILHCLSQTEHMVIVTNEVTSDGLAYDAETLHYSKILGEVNQMLAKMADEVIEVIYGIPVWIKKEKVR